MPPFELKLYVRNKLQIAVLTFGIFATKIFLRAAAADE